MLLHIARNDELPESSSFQAQKAGTLSRFLWNVLDCERYRLPIPNLDEGSGQLERSQPGCANVGSFPHQIKVELRKGSKF